MFSIGSYGNWSNWWGLRRFDPEATDVFDPNAPLSELRAGLEFRTDQWETWFQENSPDTVRYLYADELPNINILGTVIAQGQPDLFNEATAALTADPDRRYFMCNGRRPGSGSFATDDDGVALRELPWGQYKLGISRWFYWNSNYWNNFLGGPASRDLSEVDPNGERFRLGTHTNVFQSAHTFGSHDFFDPIIGETGFFNYSNGDGVLLYPGTDLVFPEESRGINGPIASLRMKHWRRGIQDIQYLDMAMQIDPVAAQAIIDAMVPRVMWELGVTVGLQIRMTGKVPGLS